MKLINKAGRQISKVWPEQYYDQINIQSMKLHTLPYFWWWKHVACKLQLANTGDRWALLDATDTIAETMVTNIKRSTDHGCLTTGHPPFTLDRLIGWSPGSDAEEDTSDQQ